MRKHDFFIFFPSFDIDLVRKWDNWLKVWSIMIHLCCASVILSTLRSKQLSTSTSKPWRFLLGFLAKWTAAQRRCSYWLEGQWGHTRRTKQKVWLAWGWYFLRNIGGRLAFFTVKTKINVTIAVVKRTIKQLQEKHVPKKGKAQEPQERFRLNCCCNWLGRQRLRN